MWGTGDVFGEDENSDEEVSPPEKGEKGKKGEFVDIVPTKSTLTENQAQKDCLINAMDECKAVYKNLRKGLQLEGYQFAANEHPAIENVVSFILKQSEVLKYDRARMIDQIEEGVPMDLFFNWFKATLMIVSYGVSPTAYFENQLDRFKQVAKIKSKSWFRLTNALGMKERDINGFFFADKSIQHQLNCIGATFATLIEREKIFVSIDDDLASDRSRKVPESFGVADAIVKEKRHGVHFARAATPLTCIPLGAGIKFKDQWTDDFMAALYPVLQLRASLARNGKSRRQIFKLP